MAPSKTRQKESSSAAQVEVVASSSLEVAVEVLRLLSGLSENVPYLGAIAGCVQRLLDIQKAMSANKQRAQDLLESIGHVSCLVAEGLYGLAGDKRSAAITSLRTDLNRYQMFLTETCEILTQWTSQSVGKRLLTRERFSGLVDGIARRLDMFRDAFNLTRLIALSNNQDLLDIKMETLVEENIRRNLNDWLKPVHVGTSQRNAEDKRHVDTGLWLVRDISEFREWIYATGSFLWLYGMSGCGKTVLSAMIIETIRERAEHYAFFYFDTNNLKQRNVTQLLCSLVMQLSARAAHPHKILNALWISHTGGQHLPSNSVLISDALIPILREFTEPVYIVLDALDECVEQDELLRIITKIVDEKLSSVHLLVTSRPEVPHRSPDLSNLAVTVTCKGRVDRDIELYVAEILSQKLGWLGEQSDDVKRRLLENSNGMFRLASLQIDELLHCDGRLSQIEKALTNMPTSLHTIYDRILENIRNPDMVSNVCRAMNWLLVSERPMRLVEIIDALAFDFESEPLRFNPAERMRPEALLTACAGLVVMSKEADDRPTIGLAHSSVKEYFLSAKSPIRIPGALEISEQAAHHLMARACIAYLCSFDHFIDRKKKTRPISSTTDNCGTSQERLACYPSLLLAILYSWNIVFWMLSHFLHVFMEFMIPITGRMVIDVPKFRNGNRDSNQLIAAALGLLRPENPQFATLSEVNLLGFLWPSTVDSERRPPALSIASFLGIGQVVCELLKQGADVNTQDRVYGTALQAACASDHFEIARLLMGKGADLNAECGKYGTPLQAACDEGHIRIVRLLLHQGADVNAQGGEYGNALNAASSDGNIDIVRMLLVEGADVNTRSGIFGAALQVACYRGNAHIVRLLLDKGADVKAEGGRCGSALQAASWCGNIDIVRLLLREGANVNAQIEGYKDALQAACSNGKTDVARLLLGQGANVNAESGGYGTALQAACGFNGSIETVQLLLEEGANVNAEGGKRGSPLQLASWRGKIKIVQLLLEAGANVNAESGGYGTALQAACGFNGSIETVQLLLEEGANVNAEGGERGSSLQLASWRGEIKIVQLLLDQGANVNAEGGEYGSALCAARSRGHTQIVQLLIDHGARELQLAAQPEA
ncbi:ankyrin repeat-containing domain protein [Mycena crocata]|nr:ankyrin repeat-containing domain protein [Mycena crocata]